MKHLGDKLLRWLSVLLIIGGGGVAISLQAQDKKTKTVQGTVMDEGGEPLPGASVYSKKDKVGVSADKDGHFVIIAPSGATLTVEFMGYESQVIEVSSYKEGRGLRIFLKEDKTNTLDEVVVTGIFTRNKESFTGAVQAITGEQLKRVANSNVVESLKNMDPSLLILDNLEAGSNPNAMASMQIRGASTIGLETTTLKSGFLNKSNQPLFILDGFETSLERITDMDMNRIQSITILKDASAKAIYGAKGSNGVIVIETKALSAEKSAVTYNGNVTIEAPDLSSYNLCNALEKLEIERREGYYSSNDSYSTAALQQLYWQRLKRAREGESTYWLSKPLRLGIGHKHSLAVELGTRDLKAIATFSYNDVQGAMKGSYRDVISGDVNLAYRRSKWTFRNILSVSYKKSEDSPWGDFSEYASLNPYYTPYDEEGNLKRILDSGSVGEGMFKAVTPRVSNPMWNANIGTKYSSEYLAVSDNFYVEYQLLKALKLVARFGLDTQRSQSDDFRPADHTEFILTSADTDLMLRRGDYTQSNGRYTTFSGDVYAQFNHKFADKHDVFATAQYNLSHTSYSEVVNYAEGFPNSNMKNIVFARQYAMDSTPTGAEGLNRNLGALLTAGYSYDNRYMMDATIKGSATSVFGTKNHWGIFWSAGVAWNIHNEHAVKDALPWLTELKLRASLGSSGNQNFSTNVALPVYTYYNSNYYNGFTGASLSNMENPNLGWEDKMEYNIGLDFRTKRINAVIDAYIADTRNLVFSRSILPSTGFASVNDNMGKVRNKGIEASLSYTVWQRKSSYLSLFAKIAVNDNRVLEISDALRAYNEQQAAMALENHSTAPVVQYYDGMPLHSIWAVRSLGINASDGKEIYLDRNGDITDTWSASDLFNCGSSDPVYNGNFGINGELWGVGLSLVFTYYGGGYLYNTTLRDKVETASLENNVDRRILAGRWSRDLEGRTALYRMPDSSSSSMATSRFVQKNNVMNISSASLYYEFPTRLVRKIHLDRLRLSFFTNDLYTFSSITVERGTSYPYARSFSFSLNLTF